MSITDSPVVELRQYTLKPGARDRLIEIFEESFKTYRDRKAFVCMDKMLTYGEADELSQALAEVECKAQRLMTSICKGGNDAGADRVPGHPQP